MHTMSTTLARVSFGEVGATDAVASMQAIDKEALKAVAGEVRELPRKAVDAVEGTPAG